jgi:hypothetical protein
MTIISPVISDGITSGGYSGSPEYVYNGTDMYATFPEWTPSNAVFSYGCDVVVTTAATGSQQRIVFGATGAGDHYITVTGVGSVAVVYRDSAGTSRSLIGDAITSGVSQHVEAKYYTDRVELWNDGVLTDTEMQPPELASLSAIAASLTPNSYFGGTISNVRLTSSSPMQNVNVMAGNGTDRYASIPTFAPVAFTSKQWVRLDDLSTPSRIWGNTTTVASRLAVNTVGSVIFTDISGGSIQTSSGDIIEGQDHFLETEVLADGSCEIWVDGVSQASATAGAFDGLAWNIDSIHKQSTAYGEGIITNQVFKNTVTGVSHTYKNTDNYEQLGSELYVDPEFNNPADWVVPTECAIVGGEAVFTATTTTRDLLPSPSPSYDAGDYVKFEVVITSLSAGSIQINPYSANWELISGGTSYSTVGTHTYVLKSLSGGDIGAMRVTSGTTLSLGSWSAKKATAILPDSTVTEYGDDVVVNGDFATDSDWTKGTGWTIANGIASSDGTAGAQSSITSIDVSSLVAGQVYAFSYDVTTLTAGTVRFDVGSSGQAEDTTRTTAGSYSETFVAAGVGKLRFITDGAGLFTGSVDNLIVKEVTAIADKQDGTWVNAVIGDLDYLPTTDRTYFCTEATGATLYDSEVKAAATNATIQNFVEGSWNNP